MNHLELIDHLKQAVLLYDKEDIEAAVEHLTLAAEAGNRDAMVILAEIHSFSKKPYQTIEDLRRILTKKQDLKYVFYRFSYSSKSIDWLEKAASLGSSRAMAILGYINRRNEEISKKWLTMAAEKGSWQAKVDLLEIWNIQTDPFMSEEEYSEGLNKLEHYAKDLSSDNEDEITHKERISCCCAMLRYGNQRQISKLSYLLSRIKCWAENNYAISEEASITTNPYKYAGLFRELEFPQRSNRPYAPVEFINYAYAEVSSDEINWLYRIIKINLDCFTEPNPIIGFTLDTYQEPVIFKGFEKAGTTTYIGGDFAYMKRKRDCCLLRADRNIPVDKNIIIKACEYDYDPDRLLSNNNEIFFGFVAEKDFSFEITHHSMEGKNITMLYCLNY